MRSARSLAIGRRASQQLLGVTVGRASYKSSNVRGVIAGKMGRNSSIYNSVFTCRHIAINSSASVPLNGTKIDVMKVYHGGPGGNVRVGIIIFDV